MNKIDNKMEATLKDLGFINISDSKFNGSYKTYKGFRLFIVKSKIHIHSKWIASILVGKIEISIPLSVNSMWVYGFNEENKETKNE